MDLAKYTGEMPNGDHVARITSVTAEQTKAGDSYNLVFHADFPELDLTNRQWRRSLKPTALPMLRDDLAAAEALREGDAYPEDAEQLARIISGDISDRYVRVQVKPSRQSGYQDFKILGLALEAA